MDRDLYLWLTDPDPGCPKISGSGSPTLVSRSGCKKDRTPFIVIVKSRITISNIQWRIAFSGGEPCDVVQPADESDDDSSNPNDKKAYYEVWPWRQILHLKFQTTKRPSWSFVFHGPLTNFPSRKVFFFISILFTTNSLSLSTDDANITIFKN